MAAAGDHPPGATADDQLVAIVQAMEALGQTWGAAAVGVAARFQGRRAFFVEAVCAEEGEHGLDRMTGDAVPHGMAGEEFGMAHPQFQPPFAHEPVGQAEVVGVEMGDDEAAGQTQAQRFAPGCLHLR